MDRKAGGLRNQTPRGAGGAEGMLGQDAAVGNAELHHQFFFTVVAQKGDIHAKNSSLNEWLWNEDSQ